MDLESLRSQRTHILITDGYLKVDERDLRKEKLYNDLKIVLLDFYERSNLESHRPKPISSAHDHKLLVTCYPN